MLYGSGKHYVWYIDRDQRLLFDTTQGGSIGDLRPYLSGIDGATGPDTPQMAIGSYPYLIHSQHRTGYPNHCHDGARTTLQVTHGEETVDLATCRTRCAAIEREGSATLVTLTPAELFFSDGLTAEIETTYRIERGGRTGIQRRLTAISDTGVALSAREYFRGCYGSTEYPEPLHGVVLAADGAVPQELEFEYLGRVIETDSATAISASLPMVNCLVELKPDGPAAVSGGAVEGHLFMPYYTLYLDYELEAGGTIATWLSLKTTDTR
jgi:hypothetical protein